MNPSESSQVFDLIIFNVQLMTMDPDVMEPYGLMKDAAIAIKSGQVTWLGTSEEAEHLNADRVLDAEGQFLSPGLIDCHTHLVFAGSRADEFEQRLNGVSYEQIAKNGGGIISTVKATRLASEASLLQLAKPRLEQLMTEGVTTVEIKSGYGLETETELKVLKVATTLATEYPVNISRTFLGAHAVPPEFSGAADDYVSLICDEMLPKVKALDLADCVDGFCENIGFNSEQMRKIFECAADLELPVKLHAEQLSDQQGAALVADFNGWSADHLEYLSEQSIVSMAKHGTVAVLLPGAFYTLSETKLPPMDLLRKHQVPIAIGSDFNPGSSPICSLKLMLHMACTLFKMTPEEALKGVTINAAKALGMPNKGIIKVGADADLCLWNIQSPAELSYTFGVNPLTNVWVAGQKR